jgi:hypothetical protein
LPDRAASTGVADPQKMKPLIFESCWGGRDTADPSAPLGMTREGWCWPSNQLVGWTQTADPFLPFHCSSGRYRFAQIARVSFPVEQKHYRTKSLDRGLKVK